MTPEAPGPSIEEIRGIADPGTADRGTDAGSRLTTADGGGAVVEASPPTLDPRDRAVVDEALLRGASVAEIVGILSARALAETTAPLPPGLPRTTSGASLSNARPNRRFTLEDVYFTTERDLTESQQRRVDQAEAKRSLVTARHSAYVEFVRKEFDALSAFVRAQFTPIVVPPYVDPYATAERISRDARRLLPGGMALHQAGRARPHGARELLRFSDSDGRPQRTPGVLKKVELEVGRRKPDLVPWLQAGRFVIGGFVPRFQAGSNQLSNHAYGLAIDIDATWNPQVKQGPRQKEDAMAALQRATGERLDVDFSNKSSGQFRKIYDRMLKISKKLMAWLDRHLQRYDQLQEEIRKADKDPKQKARATELRKELERDKDLAALDTLIRIYSTDSRHLEGLRHHHDPARSH